MTATVLVKVAFGGTDGTPGSTNDITDPDAGVRFQANDSPDTVDTAHPILVPTSGSNYSFWMHVGLDITVAPTTKIYDVEFFSDGTLGTWTNLTLKAGNISGGPPHGLTMDTEYEVATGTIDETGDEMVANHSGIDSAVDVTTYVTGSALSVDTADHTTTEKTKFVVLQLTVPDTASEGVYADEQLTFRYKEV